MEPESQSQQTPAPESKPLSLRDYFQTQESKDRFKALIKAQNEAPSKAFPDQVSDEASRKVSLDDLDKALRDPVKLAALTQRIKEQNERLNVKPPQTPR